MNDNDFRERYERILTQLLDEASASARMSLTPALETLVEISEDITESAQARVAAARATLEFALRIIEKNETARKLAELETALNEIEERQRR